MASFVFDKMAENEENRLKLHITFGASKKVLMCQLACVRRKIQDLFQLDHDDYTIQSWDEDFSDWVDVESDSVLNEQQKWKLNIVPR